MAKSKRRAQRQAASRDPRTDADDTDGPESAESPVQEDREDNSRDRELCDEKEIRDALLDLYKDIELGFTDQADRSDDIMDWWDLFNCKLSVKQTYAGNSKIFVPIIANAVNARKVRFTNQIFPQTGRYVECTTSEESPTGIIALLEHYVRKAKLRSLVTPALMKNGDIEGQYSVYVSWKKTKRDVVYRAEKTLQIEGQDVPGTEGDDIVEETIERACPHVEVIADADVLIFPQTADDIDDALAAGGGAVIIRRWSKAQIRKKIKSREIDKNAGEALIENYDAMKSAGDAEQKPKNMLDAAGIKMEEGRKFAQVYEVWTMLTYEDERRLYRTYFGGEDIILGCKRNPYWCDRVPLLSVPIDKVQGSFKGISKVKPCADMQYAANDAANEGMDSAAYAMLPIIMTDPTKNPRIGSMVLNLAAIWETDPQSTQFAKFPDLWATSFTVINSCRTEIFQTLSVTPAMMPQSSSGGQKRNQAELAQEAQVDILSTADVVTTLEEGIFTPLLQWFVDLDHQFRDKPLTVRQYGEMGVQANMETIKPIQMDRRYEFRWYGVEASRNAEQTQQQIAGMNVLRGIPPQEYAPYKLDWKPFISLLVSNIFGARMGGAIFQDMRSQLSQDPKTENELLLGEGFDIPVHPLDDDAQHIQVHQQMMQMGDPTGVVRVHVMKHVQQMAMKTQQQVAQTQQGMPGVPGGQGPGGPQPAPGVAGTPRIGAQPGQPRTQGPPGMIHRDQLHGGAGIAPRTRTRV